MKIKKAYKKFFIILIFIFFVFFLWYLERQILPRQVDDVHPLFNCTNEVLNKGDALAIVPFYRNISIAGNLTWCNEILSMNKTLIMHGVFHTYNEFYSPVSIEDVKAGMEAFKECFGYYPKIFEAPQLALSSENAKMLKGLGFEIRGYPYIITHKVFHCNDSGKYSNRFIHFF